MCYGRNHRPVVTPPIGGQSWTPPSCPPLWLASTGGGPRLARTRPSCPPSRRASTRSQAVLGEARTDVLVSKVVFADMAGSSPAITERARPSRYGRHAPTYPSCPPLWLASPTDPSCPGDDATAATADLSVMPALVAGIPGPMTGEALAMTLRRMRRPIRHARPCGWHPATHPSCPGDDATAATADPSVMPALEAGIHAITGGAGRSTDRPCSFLARRVR